MRFPVFGLVLLFWGALETLVFFPNRYGLSFLLLSTVLIMAQRIGVGKFSHKSVLFLFFGVCAWLLLLFIDSSNEQHIFSVLSSALFGMALGAVYRWKERRFPVSEKGIFSAVTVATVFIFFAVISGVMINYSFPMFFAALGGGFGAYLLMKQYLLGASRDEKGAKTYAVISGIFFAESFWIVQFWPFGYLTTAAILLIFFFVLWDFFDNYSEGGISWKRVWGNVVVLVCLTGLLLATTRWAPIA